MSDDVVASLELVLHGILLDTAGVASTVITTRVMAAVPPNSIRRTHTGRFDTDSFSMLVDCGASYCVTNSLYDFIGDVTDLVNGVQSNAVSCCRGTVQWTIDDDTHQANVTRLPFRTLRLLISRNNSLMMAPTPFPTMNYEGKPTFGQPTLQPTTLPASQ